MPMFGPSDTFVFLLLLAALVIVVSCCGLCVVLIGWRGRFAGLLLGGIVLACGAALYCLIMWTIARYWWVALAPIFLGVQSIRIWRLEKRTGGIRLSTLLFVMAFLAATVAGIGRIYRQRLIERPIVSEIESRVKSDVKTDFDGIAIGLVLSQPDGDVLDDLLSLLVQLRSIQEFSLSHCRLTPAQAKRIGDLENLQSLWLQSTDMDDRKVQQLLRLKNLRDLDLMQTEVTGEGSKHLVEARRLRRLWLSNEKISPEDVERLRAACPRLEVSYRAPSAQ